jgi:hypothetical protein
MYYILVQNRQTVLLGPINWRQRFIQTEINELIDSGEITEDYKVPATEQGYIKINDEFEIFPASLESIGYDPIHEQLAGPFWTFEDNSAIGSYTVVPLDINIAKSNLKQITAAERYRKQNSGTTVTISDNTFFVNTDKETINSLLSLAETTGTDVINYKSPNGFIPMTGADIRSVVDQIHQHIQTHFDWEKTIHETIDDANDVSQLKAITIVEPVATPGE